MALFWGGSDVSRVSGPALCCADKALSRRKHKQCGLNESSPGTACLNMSRPAVWLDKQQVPRGGGGRRAGLDWHEKRRQAVSFAGNAGCITKAFHLFVQLVCRHGLRPSQKTYSSWTDWQIPCTSDMCTDVDMLDLPLIPCKVEAWTQTNTAVHIQQINILSVYPLLHWLQGIAKFR